MNFLSLWVVLAIGVDDLFVVSETWLYSAQLPCLEWPR
jgi:hypothetical protein